MSHNGRMELPSESALLELTARFGRLRARLRDELGPPLLVLPNGKFFPDPYDGTTAAAQRLLTRLQYHTNLSDIPIEVHSTQEGSASSCQSGGCGPSLPDPSSTRLEATEDGWRLQWAGEERNHPVALTTLLSRVLAGVFLEEIRRPNDLPPAPAMQDLAGVHLGLGPLLLEGAFVYSKGCGGPRVSQLTALNAAEMAFCVTLYASLHRLELKHTVKCASTTQASLLRESADLLRANPQLVNWLRTSSLDAPTPSFSLAPPKPRWFGSFRWRERERQTDPLEALLEGTLDEAALLSSAAQRGASAKSRSSPKHHDDDELKSLVAESLSRSTS